MASIFSFMSSNSAPCSFEPSKSCFAQSDTLTEDRLIFCMEWFRAAWILWRESRIEEKSP